MSLKPEQHIHPGILAQIAGGLPPRIALYSQTRWGLRRIDTGVWYSPLSLQHKRPYPLAFGCRTEAEATLNTLGRAASEIWCPEVFSDAEYQAAIMAAEGRKCSL